MKNPPNETRLMRFWRGFGKNVFKLFSKTRLLKNAFFKRNFLKSIKIHNLREFFAEFKAKIHKKMYKMLNLKQKFTPCRHCERFFKKKQRGNP